MAINALVGAALVGGGANFLGNIFGAHSQKQANEANREIAQMNNEWSEKMMDKQNQYNIDQWNRESQYNTEMYNRQEAFQRELNQTQMDYNSLAAQRQRAEAAGYSPWALTQGANAGTISGGSSPSSSTPHGSGVGMPSPNGAVMQAVNPLSDFGNTVMGMLNWKSEHDMRQAQIEQVKIDNLTRMRHNMAQLAKTYSEVRNNDARERLDRQLYQMQPQLWQSEMDLKRHQAENFRQSALLATSERLLRDKALEILPEQHRTDTALKLAQVNMYNRSAKLSQQQFRTEVYKTLYTQYQSAGLKDANHLASRMADDVVKNLQLINKLMPWDKGGSILSGMMGTLTSGIFGYGMLRGFGKGR